ncbi:tRNA lysidine(34) synthetase TilS [Thiohalorhabdus methylotrophus]|uniref:tRNA(Ile)-lysidine synthase n=1 Tax=Thiohalorhabdus methylotrophus TaxID=3242694 RepID=A0ABV4TYT7_9GAMM
MLPKHPLRDRFLARLDSHLRRDLAVPDGSRLWIAFSGGVDSTALLAGLAALGPVRGYDLRAAHVHHGMNPEADSWARTCAETCARLGVPLEPLRWTGEVPSGQSPEAAARTGRYALLASVLASGDWLLTAHQADDQAETVLMFLARGAGLDGLSGIERKRAFGVGWLARPLLPFTRAELHGFVAACSLPAVADPTNRDPRLARARTRHQLLPCLREAMGQGVAESVARSADLLQDARAVLEDAVGGHLAEVRPDAAAPGLLDAEALRVLEPHLGRHVLRAALREADLPLPERAILEQVRDLAAPEKGSGTVVWSGGSAYRAGSRLLLGAAPRGGAAPGAWELAAGPLFWEPLGLTLQAELGCAEGPLPDPERGLMLDAGAAGSVVGLRAPWPGERVRPAGGGPDRPLRELLRAAGVPVAIRDRVPLLTDEAGRTLAVAGVATTEAGAVRPGCPAWHITLYWQNGPWLRAVSAESGTGAPQSGTSEERKGE